MGRAGRLGLAVSMIAADSEKVWYHVCKERSCDNTALHENGGCCIMYDERSLWDNIKSKYGDDGGDGDRLG